MLFVKNSVLMFNLFCFDAGILISNEESDENNVWFGYDIQNMCGFHLGFHWVSKLMHVTNLANLTCFLACTLPLSLADLLINFSRIACSAGVLLG